MDVASLGGAIGAVKALVGMTKATAEAVVDETHREKLYEIRSGLMDLQERVLADQQSRSALAAELETVKRELEALKSHKAKLDGYELVPVAVGRFVYQSKALDDKHVPHFACPKCFNTTEQIGVLQVDPGYGDGGRENRYICSVCDFMLFA